MIRRWETDPGGQKMCVLVRQVEHARLSAALAEGWGRPPLLPLIAPQVLLPAIACHDDGWIGWDAQPAVDPQRGVPLDFTEMRLADSLAIWRRSIQGVTPLGGLASHVVSSHFCELLEASDSAREDAAARRLAKEFLDEQRERQATWLHSWQPDGAEERRRAEEEAEAGLRFLQLFDLVSLWLCCTPQPPPLTVQPPGAVEVRFQLHAGGRVAVGPWPWDVPFLQVSVPARRVPAQRYADAEALAAAPSQPVELQWTLQPAA